MLLIKNGKVVRESGVVEADILIQDGKIKEIEKDLVVADDFQGEVIDAEGKYVLPGGIDVHTHFNIDVGIAKSADDFKSGTKAAIMGGTTTIVDHMGFGPEGCSLQHRVDEYHGFTDGNCYTDYGFHGVIARVDDEILSEMENLKSQGITSFKAYMTYDDKVSDYEMLELLERSKELDGIIPVHAENDSLINGFRAECIENGETSPIYHAKSRPNLTEAEAVGRLLKLAKLAGDAPVYIVHLSTREGLEEIRKAKADGQKNIFAETCPQYLTLEEDRYEEGDDRGLRYIMSPPLRRNEDVKALWQGINEGSVDVIATDHCSFTMDQKMAGKDNFTLCPNGGPGVEERFLSVFSEGVIKDRISIGKFVEVISTNPAKIYGMYPKKGVIEEGSDGDIVIVNPEGRTKYTDDNIHSKSGYTIFGELDIEASIDQVILRGRKVVEKGELLEGTDGRFIRRA